MKDKSRGIPQGHLDLTVSGKPYFLLFVKPLSDGALIGMAHPKIGDVHLSMLFNKGDNSWHIADKRDKDNPQYPLRSEISETAFTSGVVRRLKKMTQQYHPNQKCWIMTDYLKKKIHEVRMGLDPNPENVPLEFIMGKVECDFENPERWLKIKIRDLKQNERGFIIDGKHVKCIEPLSKDRMLCYSARQYYGLGNFIMKSLGLDDYLDYSLPIGYEKPC